MHVAIAGVAVSAPGLALGSATLLSLSALAAIAGLTLDISLVPDRYGVLRKVERADVEAVRDLRDEVASLRARTKLLTKDRESSLRYCSILVFSSFSSPPRAPIRSTTSRLFSPPPHASYPPAIPCQ